MSTLTDRYIHEVVRHLPEDQRDDISSEIAATIDDMVRAELDPGTHAGSGHGTGTGAGTGAATGSAVHQPGPGGPDEPTDGPDEPPEDAAERAVLRRLGDPAEFARRYTGARRYLVGPEIYPIWARVTRWLLPIVGVLAALAGSIGYLATTAQPELGGLIGHLVTSVLGALLWTFAAWTLIVVIIERSTPEDGRNPLTDRAAWDPAELDRARDATGTRVDATVSLVLLALLAGLPFVPSTFLYIGHLNGGETLVDPDLPTGWVAGYLALCAAMALIQVWRLMRPGPSPIRLRAEMALDVGFAVFLTTLLLGREQVIHPDLVPSGDGATALRWVLIGGIWLVVIWDQVETVRSNRREAAAAVA